MIRLDENIDLTNLDVDNPEKCHDHSEVPDTWPPLSEMLDYAHRVRSRITDSLVSGQASTDRKLGRGLWLAYEHEAMHLETFLYMLLQSERVLPPPGQKIPDFATLATVACETRVDNKWHRVPASEIKLGLDDAENDNGPDRYFGWDNERPSRTIAIKAFEAQSRPITNGEYAHFLEATHKSSIPASWIANRSMAHGTSNGLHDYSTDHMKAPSFAYVDSKAVRTVYGAVPLKYALDWPVMASYDELAAFARWSNGRIPTLEEARSIYNYVDSSKKALEKVQSTLISAVNG
jgi:formylglycine-generating enzyme required for sulfatase activity